MSDVNSSEILSDHSSSDYEDDCGTGNKDDEVISDSGSDEGHDDVSGRPDGSARKGGMRDGGRLAVACSEPRWEHEMDTDEDKDEDDHPREQSPSLQKQSSPREDQDDMKCDTVFDFNGTSGGGSWTTGRAELEPALSLRRSERIRSANTKVASSNADTKVAPSIANTKVAPSIASTKVAPRIANTKVAPSVASTKVAPCIAKRKRKSRRTVQVKTGRKEDFQGLDN